MQILANLVDGDNIFRDRRRYQLRECDRACGSRKRGISAYQFRSPSEWFAELYAAYFSGKLKEVNPAVSWLKDLKTSGNA